MAKPIIKVSKYKVGDKVHCTFSKANFILTDRYDITHTSQRIAWHSYEEGDSTRKDVILRDHELIDFIP
jgi:hypothetical protein